MSKGWRELRQKCQQYHLVHGVIGVVVLSMRAADPGWFQQLFFLFLLVALLLLLLLLPVRTFPLPLSLAVSLGERLLGVSAPDGGVAALSAQAGGALRPPVPLLLPAATFAVSARRPAARRRLKEVQLGETEATSTASYHVSERLGWNYVDLRR